MIVEGPLQAPLGSPGILAQKVRDPIVPIVKSWAKGGVVIPISIVIVAIVVGTRAEYPQLNARCVELQLHLRASFRIRDWHGS